MTDELSAFSRLISPTHKNVFDKIFQTLETGLSKLGETSGARTKAISSLLQLIRDIPMDGKQDYDVLGFIYEKKEELLIVEYTEFNEKYNERDITARQKMKALIDSEENKVTHVFSTLFER